MQPKLKYAQAWSPWLEKHCKFAGKCCGNWFERAEPQRRTRQNTEIREEGEEVAKDMLKARRAGSTKRDTFFKAE